MIPDGYVAARVRRHMSGIGGIIPGMNYSLLFSSNGASTTNTAGAILSTLYSGASGDLGAQHLQLDRQPVDRP